jgi:hypothetical protein
MRNRLGLWPQLNAAPTHHTGVVTRVQDDQVDALLFVPGGPVEIPQIQHLPGMELKRGYRVVVSAFNTDCCITAVIGFMTDEQIAGVFELARDWRNNS